MKIYCVKKYSTVQDCKIKNKDKDSCDLRHGKRIQLNTKVNV